MGDFSDFSAWGLIFILITIFGSLLLGNVIKKSVPFMRNSLIPVSVIGGLTLLIIAEVYGAITGKEFFNSAIFGGNGYAVLEIITYHSLALGFIASTLRSSNNKVTKRRVGEVFNAGVTTVSTYLLQAIVGITITVIATLFITDFFPAAGALLCFGFGQGTGQALNYGNIYQNMGLAGGRSFGLTIAALGFLSASIGGVIHLSVLKKKGKLPLNSKAQSRFNGQVEGENEISMQGSIDKLTVQLALIIISYAIAYVFMYLLCLILKGDNMRNTIYGFNFLLGVVGAVIVKTVLKFLRKKNIVKKQYTNNFLLTRTSNLFYDIMVVAGIAAIQLGLLEKYWGVIIILALAGLIVTYIYNRIVVKVLYKDYAEEQFMAMYGMLTGTASTGVILLREIDGEFKTPAADNLVYQTLPAIAFGFPMMILATFAPSNVPLTMVILVVYFIVMNLILFRNQIFRRKKKACLEQPAVAVTEVKNEE